MFLASCTEIFFFSEADLFLVLFFPHNIAFMSVTKCSGNYDFRRHWESACQAWPYDRHECSNFIVKTNPIERKVVKQLPKICHDYQNCISGTLILCTIRLVKPLLIKTRLLRLRLKSDSSSLGWARFSFTFYALDKRILFRLYPHVSLSTWPKTTMLSISVS